MVGGSRVAFSTNFAPLLRQIPSECFTQFPSLTVSKQELSEPWGLCFPILWMVLSPSLLRLLTHRGWVLEGWLLIPGALSLCLVSYFSFLFPENISLLASLGSQLLLNLGESYRLPVVPPCQAACRLTLGSHRALFFLSPWHHGPAACWPVSWKWLHYMLCPFSKGGE